MIPISKWPGLKAVTFWPDPDSSVIEFAGGRRKISRMLSGFIDHGAGNEPQKIEVSYQLLIPSEIAHHSDFKSPAIPK